MNEIELLVRDLYGKYAPNSFSEDKISYVKENYENPEDFVKDFYGKYAPEEYSEDKIQYIRDNYLSKVDDLGKPEAVQDAAPVTAEGEAVDTDLASGNGLSELQEPKSKTYLPEIEAFEEYDIDAFQMTQPVFTAESTQPLGVISGE